MRRPLTHIIFLAFFIMGLGATSYAQNFKLQADHFHFNEKDRTLNASSNVVLKSGEAEVHTEIIKIDVDNEMVWGTGNVRIIRGNDRISSRAFQFDLRKNMFHLKDVEVTIVPPGTTANLYLKAEELIDFGHYKVGKNGIITTCDEEKPHYYLKAAHFTYTPDQRITGKNVFIYAPIYFIPFGFWMPYYNFEIGKRQVVLLVPLMGNNSTEGTFVKNTVDYYYGKEKHGQLYIDYMSNKGFGLGVNHNYIYKDPWRKKEIDGHLKFYWLQDSSTGLRNTVYELANSYPINKYLTFSHSYNLTDMYRLFGGQTNTESQSYSMHYDELGNQYLFDADKNSNVNFSSNITRFSYDRRINNRNPLSVDYSINENDSNNQRIQNAKGIK